ncbi:MAG: hypothetical protein ACOX4F_05430 [Atopobiaceae bacterium]|jgi:hypothetical protein
MTSLYDTSPHARRTDVAHTRAYEPTPYVPNKHASSAGTRAALTICAIVARLAALLLSVLTLAGCFSTLRVQVYVFELTALIAQMLPRAISGLYVIDTPFGGAFRGDFALVAALLFVLDWILCRVRAKLGRKAQL